MGRVKMIFSFPWEMKFICWQNEHSAIFLFSMELVSLQKSIATWKDFLSLLWVWGDQNILQNLQHNPTKFQVQNKSRCSSCKKQSCRLPQPPQILLWAEHEILSKFSPNSFQKSQLLFLPEVVLASPKAHKGLWREELEEDKLALALAKLSLEILACHFFCGICFFHLPKQRRLFWGQSSSLLLLLQCWDKSCQKPWK